MSQTIFRLRNDLYCVEWGVKLYSLTSQTICRWTADSWTCYTAVPDSR